MEKNEHEISKAYRRFPDRKRAALMAPAKIGIDPTRGEITLDMRVVGRLVDGLPSVMEGEVITALDVDAAVEDALDKGWRNAIWALAQLDPEAILDLAMELKKIRGDSGDFKEALDEEVRALSSMTGNT
jgi:hypothetical protein